MNELKSIISKLDILIKSDRAQRTVLTTMQQQTADRIFNQGKDATNSQIGTYSKGYLKTRQRNNWPSSNKVILQATRQMVNDWSAIFNNGIGLGFKNSANTDKSLWVEETYDKSIFEHTQQEEQLIGKLWNEEVRKILK